MIALEKLKPSFDDPLTASKLASYSRNNNTESELVKIDFHRLIHEILEGYKHLTHADKINFEVEINMDQVIVSDRFRLQVILSNLISNAIKYHRVQQDFPFVKISVIVIDAKLFITVKDNCIGINAVYIDEIFDMFMRANDYSDGSA